MSEITTVDAGPRRVSRRAVIDAPVQELFALVANPHRHAELDGSGTVKPEVIGPRELHPGDRFTVRMRMRGVPYRITSSVSRLYPGKLIEWRHPAGHRWRFAFEDLGGDRTAVTETWDYSGQRLGRIYEWLRFPALNARGIRSTLEQLQRRYG
ncbi:dimethyladenosine transferase [Tersicoccus phoenicis]|uniref:Dimethyladenosine transferase n=1 Tax=Tersicoccus phoenicis TaxID=554083 RepID=A0A1R1L772_9MICC|nr:SRPBCC family protein [Tersicoccus phoenicis]OMH23259.1 dimethyladenosine transferase [Tersicoccus phoenicis]